MTESAHAAGADAIEVNPVVVLFQVFPARPSSIPDIRDFVRRCLAESPLTEEGNRQVGETVFRALLDAAGPEGSIQVAFRIFPEHVEVDVLHSDNQAPAGSEGAARPDADNARQPRVDSAARAATAQHAEGAAPAAAIDSGPAAATTGEAAAANAANRSATFAEWMSVALRREGLTQQAAARLLGVSVKTVSRWVGGATEPRLRDLRRIQEVFGEVPLP